MLGKSKLIIAVVLVAGLMVGFFVGTQVQASSFAPGSVDDPLVAQSYLEEQLQLRVNELEREISKLRDQANQLQALVNQLVQ